jgi:RNA polymerase sigma-70 factor (ECF subfamily)
MPDQRAAQDELYQEAAAAFAPCLERLASAYEADREERRDLLQDIHAALWRSLADFEGRCSLRTWVYRVAHNVAISHVTRRRRNSLVWVGLEELESMSAVAPEPDRRAAIERLLELIRRLKPLERQVILSYLEGLDAAAIAEITGISPANVAVRIHRIKRILARRFQEGGQHE